MERSIEKFTARISEYCQAKESENQAEMNRVKNDIKELLCLPAVAPHILVLISSLTPGTGATTARNLLAEILGFEHPEDPISKRALRDAGKYRRFLAAMLSIRRKSRKLTRGIWDDFSELVMRDPNAIDEVLKYYGDERYSYLFDEDTLSAFNEALRKYTSEESRQTWTKIPDIKMAQQIHRIVKNERGGAFTGKLTARIDSITDTEEELAEKQTLIARFLLRVTPEEGARRVMERDMNKGLISHLLPGTPEFKQEIVARVRKNSVRMEQDKQEYASLYSIDVDTFFDHEHGIEIIDTTDKTPEQVVGYMLFIISQMLVRQPCEDPMMDDEFPEAS